MKNMTPEEYLDYKISKLRRKRNILFRAFLINLVAILIVWLISMTPLAHWVMGRLTPFSAAGANMYIMSLLGIWKIIGYVLFLVPALAIWWEMCDYVKREA